MITCNVAKFVHTTNDWLLKTNKIQVIQTWIWPVTTSIKIRVFQLHMHANQPLCGNDNVNCDFAWLDLTCDDLWLDLTGVEMTCDLTWLALWPKNLWLDLDLQQMTWDLTWTCKKWLAYNSGSYHFQLYPLVAIH